MYQLLPNSSKSILHTALVQDVNYNLPDLHTTRKLYTFRQDGVARGL